MIAFLTEENESDRPTQIEGLAWQTWGASHPGGAFARAESSDADEFIEVVLMNDPVLSEANIKRLRGLQDLPTYLLETALFPPTSWVHRRSRSRPES